MKNENDHVSNGSSSINDADVKIFDAIIYKLSLSCFNNSKQDVK